MKALKYIFILLLVVIIASAIYFSLQDGHYEVERSAQIEAPRSMVYDQMSDLKNWDNWNAYNKDEDVSVSYGNLTSGVDAQATFTDETGDGVITITRLEPNTVIEMNMEYTHSLGVSKAKLDYRLADIEQGTEATMHIEGDHSLVDKVFNSISGMDMEKELGAAYETSLTNLEAFLQNQMDQYSISPDGLIDYGGGYYLYMSSSSTLENLPRLQSQMIQKIRSYMQTNNIDSYGAPMVIYEKFDDDQSNVIFSAGIPVKDRVITAVNSTILCGFQEPGKAVKVTLKGNYKYLQEAWQIGEGFITVNGLTRSNQTVFEFYKTNSYKEANPANYITEVYLPVE